MQEVKNSDYCQYIRPPIDKYRTLQFGSFDEIREVGYRHGKAYFEGQFNAKSMVFLKNIPSALSKQSVVDNVRYTFTDLAQIVSQVQRYNEFLLLLSKFRFHILLALKYLN